MSEMDRETYIEILRRAVAVLNRALEADPEAITELVNTRVTYNDALADDPTVQVGLVDEGIEGGQVHRVCRLGPLGLINGLFGVDEFQSGYIYAEGDRTSQVIQHFGIAEERLASSGPFWRLPDYPDA